MSSFYSYDIWKFKHSRNKTRLTREWVPPVQCKNISLYIFTIVESHKNIWSSTNEIDRYLHTVSHGHFMHRFYWRGARGRPSYSDSVPLMSNCRLINGSLSRIKTASRIASFFLLEHRVKMLVLSTIILRVRFWPCSDLMCFWGAPFCKCIVMRRDSVVVVWPM